MIRGLQPLPLASASVLACQSDERLVELFRAGHDGAFEALVRRYRRPLVGYCRRLLPDDRSEDVVQQAFLNAYEAMRVGTGELRVRAWLYRIVYNGAIDVLRRRHGDDLPEGDEHAGAEAPDEVLERRERLREVVTALQALPPRQRDAIVLQEFEGRSHHEIAARIGVSESAVRQLIHRARGGLRAGVSALTPLSLLEGLLRAPRAEAFAARLPDLVAGAAGGGGAAKAIFAVVAVTALGGGGIASNAALTGAPSTSIADERTVAIATPSARAGTQAVAIERVRGSERSRASRRGPQEPKRRDDGRARRESVSPATPGEVITPRRDHAAERERDERPQEQERERLDASDAVESPEPPDPVEVGEDVDAPDEPEGAEVPEYEAPDEPEEHAPQEVDGEDD